MNVVRKVITAAVLFLPLCAAAQSGFGNYPSKTVRFICPFPAGGAVDFMSRFFAQRMTPAHLATELLKSMTGVRMVHVPYKGAGAAIPAVLAGESQVLIEPVASAMPHVHSGRVRALAVTSATRTPILPELPTVTEAGVPGFESTSWYGVIIPAATPAAVVARLNSTLNRILEQPDVKEQLTAQAMLIVGGTPDAFGTRIKAEMARWGKVVKDTGGVD